MLNSMIASPSGTSNAISIAVPHPQLSGAA
jgi:hypothetical protein